MDNGNLILPPFRASDYKQEVHAQVSLLLHTSPCPVVHLLQVVVDRIHDLHVDHPQTYRCIAENELGKIQSRDVHVRAGRVNVSSFAMYTVDEDKTSRCDKIKHWHHWTWLDKLDVTFRREKEDSWHTKWDRTQPDQKMVGLNSKLSRKDIPQQDQNLTPLLTKH